MITISYTPLYLQLSEKKVGLELQIFYTDIPVDSRRGEGPAFKRGGSKPTTASVSARLPNAILAGQLGPALRWRMALL